MRISSSFKNTVVEIICFLYILLFVYAAVSKVLDFENFKAQLGQSPMLSAFASSVAWAVPFLELCIASLLFFKRYRIIGLFGSFSLMIMFTVYIFIILNYSSFIPCSCGGILEKLGWKEHLFFNVVFIILAAVGILILACGVSKTQLISKPAALASAFLLSSLFSIGLVVTLFMLSEDIIHRRNNFVRRFPHHPANLTHSIDLQHNTYYIAGIDGNKIFLGNTKAPLVMTVIDTTLKQKKTYRITLPQNNYGFHSVRVRVLPPFFYVSDGTVPVVFKGHISNWESSTYMHGKAYFTHMEPITNKLMIIRAISSSNGENILGTIKMDTSAKVKISDKLLHRQIDGIFDTDGTMIYNYQLDKIIYTYFYRNEFIVADTLLNLNYRGHTIDTTTHVNIKVAYIKSRKESKLSTPPYVVNKNTATFNNYLFVHAGLIGKYEDEQAWQSASIVDVYDLLNKTYGFSFYLEDIAKNKVSDFKIEGALLVTINGHYLSTYQLKHPFGF